MISRHSSKNKTEMIKSEEVNSMYQSVGDVSRLQQRAQAQESDAKKASTVVANVISHMNPQRHYSEDKSQNKR